MEDLPRFVDFKGEEIGVEDRPKLTGLSGDEICGAAIGVEDWPKEKGDSLL